MFFVVVLSLIVACSPAFAQQVEEKRPALLIPLYASHVALQGLDVHSTLMALERGHREANPLLANPTPARLMAAKAVASGTAVFLVERMWKRHPKSAVFVMIATNVAMSMVVANNYRIAGS